MPNTIELQIHGIIGEDVSSSDIISKLKDNPNAQAVMIDINSPGGSCFDGFAIYNALKTYPAPKHVKITGICASISSVIAMSGSTIEMTKNAMMMIHLPTVAVSGNSDDLRREAAVLDQLKESIKDAYKSKLKTTVDLDKLLSEQTWIKPEDAKNMGLCDIVSDTTPINKFFNLSQFNYKIPQEVFNMYDAEKNKTQIIKTEDILTESFLDKFKKFLQIFNNHKELNMTPEEIKKEEERKRLEEEVAKNACGDKKMKDLEAQNEALVAENSALKAEKDALANAKALSEKNERDIANKAFVDSLVASGKLLPTSVKIHCDILESRHVDKVSYDEYKAMLESLPVAIEVNGHVATKDRAAEFVDGMPSGTEAKAKELYENCKKNGIKRTYGDCMKEAIRSIK
jgi:ATP-dependent protease ClpP protease subunit